MKRIAKFEKVSRSQFAADFADTFGYDGDALYDTVKLPRRATTGSAGDGRGRPMDVTLCRGGTAPNPTGVRAWMEDGWVLKIYPRSGLGFKYRLQLNNTVGIIDSDYYHAQNEGHIFIKITNDSNEGKTVSLAAGDAFAQGIFLEYGITLDDDADGVREGGFGSTSK